MASGIRGCGYRIKGAVYVECRLGARGLPLEHFLIDSPQVLDTNALGIRPRGMTPVLREDATHLFDWVGMESYPSPVDFIEEARRKGVSRRILPSLVSDLTPDSRLLLIHPRAHVHNAYDFWHALDASGRMDMVRCPSKLKGDTDHPDVVKWALNSPAGEELPQPWCLGACYHDIKGRAVDNGQVEATIGDVTYRAYPRPALESVDYKPALFMAVPINCISVIRDPGDAERTNKLFGQVRDLLGDLPVFLEDQ